MKGSIINKKLQRRLISLTTCLSLLIGCLFINSAKLSVFGAQNVTLPFDYDSAASILSLVNTERANYGLEPLALDADLQAAAMLRAAETTVSFGHTRPSGQSNFTVSNKSYAENIAMGYGSASAAVNGWMNSTKGHRENILNASYTTLGVGVVNYNGTKYFVQEFGYDNSSLGSPISGGQFTATVDVMGTGEVNTVAFNNAMTTAETTSEAPTTTAHTHSFGAADCTHAATCTCGATNGSALGHDYGNNNQTCSRCGNPNPNYQAPTTEAPTTVAPTTAAPTTAAPTTAAPTTVAPTTAAPTTAAPTTVAPTTVAPTTIAPTTVAPTTEASTSDEGTKAETTIDKTTADKSTAEADTTNEGSSEVDDTDTNTTDIAGSETESPVTEESTTNIFSEHETLSQSQAENISAIIEAEGEASLSLGILEDEGGAVLCITIDGSTYPLSSDEASSYLEDSEILASFLECSEDTDLSPDEISSVLTSKVGSSTLDFVRSKDGSLEVYISDEGKHYRKVNAKKAASVLGDKLASKKTEASPTMTEDVTAEPTSEEAELTKENEATSYEESLENMTSPNSSNNTASSASDQSSTSKNNDDNIESSFTNSLLIAIIILASALLIAVITLIIVLIKRTSGNSEKKQD